MSDSARLTHHDLVHHLAQGCKPQEQWAIGTEHEKFVYHRNTGVHVAYDEPHGIEFILDHIAHQGWQSVYEKNHLIALTHNRASITLEPACQFELSGAPLRDLHATQREFNAHIQDIAAATEHHNIGFCSMGFHPHWTVEACARVPKARYNIMRSYLPTKGTRGLDMMHRTCTIQVNMDFSSEADMLQKLRTSLALQPFVTALFASSPLQNGQLTTFQSLRSLTWTDTDNERCGLLPMMFDADAGFERYVDFALDVPMFFVYREGEYIPAAGQSFRDFMRGQLPALPGVYPTIDDWASHLTTLFPEVRLKQFLEMRGADGGPQSMVPALGALWAGLIYHQPSLDALTDRVEDWNARDLQDLRLIAAREGIHGQWNGIHLADFLEEMLVLAEAGLRARNMCDEHGHDETRYLAPLYTILNNRMSHADTIAAAFRQNGLEGVHAVMEEWRYTSNFAL